MNFKSSLFPYLTISLALIICVSSLRFVFSINTDTYTIASATPSRRCVILDAGHGGKDGGAVSVSGTYEKTLNLDVTLNIEDVLYILGYDIILTRTDDTELTHADGGTRKMQDLKGRLEISKNNPDVPFISIHMNKFPQSKYSGLQIYYSSNNDESKNLSELIRQDVISKLQPDNNRQIKRADDKIYLLDKITSVAVLIECGFLSNEKEAQLLDDHIYRMKLSFVIANALNVWYNSYIKT